jgi:non-reducing end alpha-L-arabinofuranosidase
MALVSCQMLAGLDDRHTATSAAAGDHGLAGGGGFGSRGKASGEEGGTAGRPANDEQAGGDHGRRTGVDSGGMAGETAEAGAAATGAKAQGGTEAGGASMGADAAGGTNRGGAETGAATGGNAQGATGAKTSGDAGGAPAAGGTHAGRAATGGVNTGGVIEAGTEGSSSGPGGDVGSGGNPTGGTAAAGATGLSGGVTTGGLGGTSTGGAATGGLGGTSTGGAGTGGLGGTSTGGAAMGGAPAVIGPCDIYADGDTPCVAAYSMVRVLSSAYRGPLYQVRKGGGTKNTGSGGTTQDIMAIDGFADAATQEGFCGTDTCTVSKLYDQSGKGNHLTVAKKGCYGCPDGNACQDDYESDAKRRSLTVGGHTVYALYMGAREGYRNNHTSGMPRDEESQGLYEVADGTHGGPACCWDFGNASTNNCYGAIGGMNALFFGSAAYWGTGAGEGPWFMVDFEGGIWAGGSGAAGANNPKNPSMRVDYAFGTLTTNATDYAIRTGNAQSGDLTTAYDGPTPMDRWTLQGGIILGIGEDNANDSWGTFFEGAIALGRPTLATDQAVLKNVQAAGYGK